MDFTYVEFPCTVDKNVLKAYFDIEKTKLPKSFGKTTHSYDLNETNTNQAKSLRHLVLDAIISNWNENPIFKELPRQEDRNYILSNLDVNIPLKQLSRHIRSSFFWNKAFCHRWKVQHTVQPRQRKPWINIYMERHLQEFIENVQTSDYDQESVQETLDICAEYINQLEINFLQPSPDGQHNHIPLDFILSNLPELHTLRLTYCTKSLGMNFYLGCNTLSKRDVLHLARGLSRSHELLHFCLHSTKLSPYQLHPIARNLDRGCHNLTSLALVHCSFGNEGIRKFLQACNKESFSTLKILDLTNNKITAEGALLLSRSLRNLKLEKFILRFNPIQSDGAAIIFSLLNYLPIKYLDISCCCICVGITKLFMQLVVENKILRYLDVSNNELNEEFGVQLYKIIGFNKTLQVLDVRNTGLSFALRNKFKDILKLNFPKKCFKLNY